jgi:hypothetical protein
MATPHISGAAAILLQKIHDMSSVWQAMKSTAFQKLHKPFLVPSTCGNTSYNIYPNNIYGYGVPDIGRAIEYLDMFSVEMMIVSERM